jgi:hypothetical protein
MALRSKKLDLLKVQQGTAKVVSVVVVIAALVLTYMGTALFCHQHGADGWRGYTIAGINDLVVLLGIVWPERPIQVVAGFCAAFTVWANVSHAGEGFSGLVVSFIGPGLAIGLITALEMVARGSHAVAQIAEPVESESTHREPSPVAQIPGPDEAQAELAQWEQELTDRLNAPEPKAPVVRLVAAASVPDEAELVEAPEGGWTKPNLLARMAEEGWTTAQAVRYTGKPKATINRWKAQATKETAS